MNLPCAHGIRRIAVGGALAVALTSGAGARADESDVPDARLRLVYEAPRECEGASGFRDRVTSLVRTPPRTWRSAVEVRVAIERTERVYVGRLRIIQSDATDRAPSERSLGGTSCASVVEALAVSAALAVDDALEEIAAAQPPSPHENAVPPPPATARPHPPMSRKPPKQAVPSPRAPLELRSGSMIGLRRGLAPDALWLHTAWISVGRPASFWPPPLRAEVTYGASPVARVPEGAYRTRLFEGAVSACTPTGGGLFAVVTLCAGASGGVLETSSFEVVRPARRERAWGGVFAAPRAAIPVAAGLRVVFEARVVVPFVRESQVFFPAVTVYEAPPIALQAAVGLEVTFPLRSR